MRHKWTESFLLEAEDLLADIEQCALAVSGGETSDEIVGRLFRGFHTIKGSGAMCGFDQVAAFTHHIETLLDDVREGRVALQPGLAELILASVDQIKFLLAADDGPEPAEADQTLIERIRAASASAAGDAPSRNEGAAVAPQSGDEQAWDISFQPDPGIFTSGGNPSALFRELGTLGALDVTADLSAIPSLEELDPAACYFRWKLKLRGSADENAIRDVFIFVEDGAQLSIVPAVSTTDETEPPHLQNSEPADSAESTGKPSTKSVAAANPAKAPAKESTVRVPAVRLDRLVNLVGEMVMNQARLAQAFQLVNAPELANPVQEMERLVAELRENVLGIRMLPIGSIFGRFQRLVHDLSLELGKEVVLLTEGAETELDKSILDQLGEPLVHMIRNSVDHGIEPVATRLENGKPRHGTIRLSAIHRGSDVIVSIQDDGRGINRAAVRAKAVSRNLIAGDAALSDKELLNLILLPGFSTAQQITSVSGRGVGMDVVKKQIEALRGSLSIASVEGEGTTMSLSLPLTLAIIEGLIVQVGADQFIIPMAAITENVELESAQRSRNNGRNVISVRGELVPYIDLRSTFRVEGAPPSIEKVVIVRHEDERVGLVVDRVLGTHQTVLQSLGHFLENIHVVSGATILGDGRVALVLDIPAVVNYAESKSTQAIPKAINNAEMAWAVSH